MEETYDQILDLATQVSKSSVMCCTVGELANAPHSVWLSGQARRVQENLLEEL
jgi:hypothetical protein